MNSWITNNVWLIPAAPIAASLLILAFGKAARRAAAAVAILGQIAALTMSIFAFVPTLRSHGFRAIQNFTWFTFGDQSLRIGFVLDPLAAAMLLMISLVGLCIFVFSIGYMAEDKNFSRFFAYLSFFSGAMLGVVVANSLLLLFVFWELVGLASYLLIGFWIERPSAAAAAKKAFITTRIGDMAFFLGILWLYHRSGTLLFYDGGRGCLEPVALSAIGSSVTLVALSQFDIKRILAYSTVSQLGLMMVSLGAGGVAAGIMHLLAHGFFKALLFLGAGSVIHGVHHEQDIRKMGGLRRLMPITFSTYAVGMMALSGVPFFFSGGWTKEGILHATSNWPGSHLPHYLTLIGVILTALYMTRQIIYVFFGNRRAASEHAHESPSVMTIPLMVLAVCAVFLCVVLRPASPLLEFYLTGRPARVDAHLLIQPMIIVSLALVGAGVSVGIWMYRRAGEADPLQHAQPALFRFLENKMWVDEIYDRTVIALSAILARLSDWMDRHVWDGLVQDIGRIGQFFGRVTTSADERVINAGVDESTSGAHGLGRLMSRWHSGQIQTYLGAVALGMLALVLLYAWLG